jgi:hypothetical protein
MSETVAKKDHAALPELLDHVIIGPSYRQEEMCREVRILLDERGLAHVPIRSSEIPYRANKTGQPAPATTTA